MNLKRQIEKLTQNRTRWQMTDDFQRPIYMYTAQGVEGGLSVTNFGLGANQLLHWSYNCNSSGYGLIDLGSLWLDTTFIKMHCFINCHEIHKNMLWCISQCSNTWSIQDNLSLPVVPFSHQEKTAVEYSTHAKCHPELYSCLYLVALQIEVQLPGWKNNKLKHFLAWYYQNV